jgi:protease YdgD
MFVRLSSLVGLATAAVALAAAVAVAAVFGPDDRIDVPPALRPAADAIGLLTNARDRIVCTAICAKPDVIVTAAHCLFRTAGQPPPRLAEFWFTAGPAGPGAQTRVTSRLAGHLTGSTAQHVTAGATRLSVAPPIDATSDWALVKLAQPICRGRTLPLAPLSPEAVLAAGALGRLSQVAYHRDRQPWRPAWSQPCQVARRFGDLDWPAITADFSAPATLLLHTCDTGGASSGSPILVAGPDGPRMVGLNVGTYVTSRVVMRDGRVAERSAPETVANTAVAVAAFAERLEQFQSANILSGRAAVRELQAHLRTHGHFAGPLDGRYSDDLRTAIEAFERARRLPVTGLATGAVLRLARAAR